MINGRVQARFVRLLTLRPRGSTTNLRLRRIAAGGRFDTSGIYLCGCMRGDHVPPALLYRDFLSQEIWTRSG